MALGDQHPKSSGIVLGPRLAEGGMAEVFAAQLVGGGGFAKDIVVKRVLPQLARDPEFITRFMDEARLAAQLNHPAIAQVLQLVVDGDDLMMAIELVDGADLSTILKRLRREERRRMPLPIALRIMAAVAGALAYAHDKRGRDNQPLGIIHRDVTPSNILVSRDGATKLIDFGIARANSAARVTRRGSIVGKLHYLSPEQVRDGPIDARADVWAFGVVLFQILTGARPFAAEDERAVLERIVSGARADVRAAVPAIPEALALVVDGCLAVRAEDRIASARSLERALEDVIAANGLYASAADLGAFVSALVPPLELPAPAGRADGREVTEEAPLLPAPPPPSTTLPPDDGSTAPARRPRRASLTLDVDEEEPENTERTLTLLDSAARDASTVLTAPSSSTSEAETRTLLTRADAETQILPQRRRRPAPPRRAPRVVAAVVAAAAVVAVVMIVVAGRRSPPPLLPERVERAAQEPARAAEEAAPVDAVAARSAPAEASERPEVAVEPLAPLDDARRGGAPRERRASRASPPRAVRADAEVPHAAVSAPDAGVEAPPRVSAEHDDGVGTLVVDARPWARVSIDGVDVGVTPVAARTLKAGAHTIVLENPEQRLRRTVTAQVVKGQQTTTRVDLHR